MYEEAVNTSVTYLIQNHGAIGLLIVVLIISNIVTAIFLYFERRRSRSLLDSLKECHDDASKRMKESIKAIQETVREMK